jgi:hypothetical protein
MSSGNHVAPNSEPTRTRAGGHVTPKCFSSYIGWKIFGIFRNDSHFGFYKTALNLKIDHEEKMPRTCLSEMVVETVNHFPALDK